MRCRRRMQFAHIHDIPWVSQQQPSNYYSRCAALLIYKRGRRARIEISLRRRSVRPSAPLRWSREQRDARSLTRRHKLVGFRPSHCEIEMWVRSIVRQCLVSVFVVPPPWTYPVVGIIDAGVDSTIMILLKGSSCDAAACAAKGIK